MQISIVIPNFNHAKYLGKALEHALAQTYQPCEILVIDDCSTDNSVEVIEQYAVTSPLIRLIKNERNMGVIHNLNFGLSEAKGEYVLLSAADDWIEPHLLAEANQAFTEFPYAGFFSAGAWYVNEDSPEDKFPMRMPLPTKFLDYIAPHRAHSMQVSMDSWFIGNSTIYNREVALKEGGFDPDLGSFTDNFFCRYLAVKYGCCFSPKKLATWRIRRDGYASSYNVDPVKQQQVFQRLQRVLNNQYSNEFGPQLKKRILSRYKFNVARARLQGKGIIRKLQTLVLFLMMRHFDLKQQLKLYLLQRYKRNTAG